MEYNRGFDDMSEQIKRLWGPRPQVDYRTKQMFWMVRLVTIAVAYGGDVRQVIIVSMLQFIVQYRTVYPLLWDMELKRSLSSTRVTPVSSLYWQCYATNLFLRSTATWLPHRSTTMRIYYFHFNTCW